MKNFGISRTLFVMLASTGAMALGIAQAHAQAQSAPVAQNAPAAAEGPGVADIIVTATRRAEKLQDVPVSVTALTKDMVARQNVRDLGDLPKMVPGLTLNYGTQPGNFSINLRGIGTLTNGIAVESDVAVVIDDVPAGFQAEAFKDLVDIERIEALKGPQSTLFGKSAISGVLNIVTQAPTDHWTGHATALGTSDDEWRVGGTVAGPLTDNLKIRVTGARNSWNGNVNNLTTGDHLNGSKGLTFTGKLQWDPTDRLMISLQPRYNHADINCCVTPINALTPGTYYQGITQLPVNTVLSGINYNDPYNRNIRNDERAGGISDSIGTTLRANYRLGGGLLNDATVSYIGSYDSYRMRDFQDVDATDSYFLKYYPLTAPSGIDSGATLHGLFRVHSTTQELRLTSPSGPFRYLVGLWYAHNSLSRDLNRGPVLQTVHYLAQSTNTTYSLYTDLAWDVAPKVTLIGGFRLNRQSLNYVYDNYTAAPPFHLGGGTSDNAVTGKAGLQYHVTRDNMIYGTFSTGYKGQAYDLSSVYNATIAAQSPVAPETARNYEIGTKNSFFNRKLVLNATAFWTDYHGFQTSSITVLPNGFPLAFLQSVGHLRTRGIEAEVTARPTSRLSLNGSGAYTDAKIIDYPGGPCYPGQATVALASNSAVPAPGQCGVLPSGSSIQNLSGARLNNAPVWKFNMGGQYDIPLAHDRGAFIGFNYRWQSAVNYSLNTDPTTIQRAYGILDASAGLSAGGGKYKLTVFANNLLNKHYAVNLYDSASGFSAPGVNTRGTMWQPARDAWRYFGVKLDAGF